MLKLVLLVLVFVGLAVADTWVWSEPKGYSPQPRFGHTTNRVGNRLFVFGGTLSNDVKETDLHVLDMDSMKWDSPMIEKKPPPTTGHASVMVKNQMYVLFGSNGRTMTNHIYQLDTDSLDWTRVVSEGRVPTPRAYHSAVAVDGEVYTFGGFDGKFYLNDLHKWTIHDPVLNISSWSKLQQTGAIPDVRASPATALYGRKLYLFGGFEIAVYKNDFFVLDLDTLVWSPITLSRDTSCPMPGPRAMSSLTFVGGKMVLFGGTYCSSNGTCVQLNDVHQFDMFKLEFQTKEASGVLPPARYGHTSTLVGSKMLVFGGAAWPILYNDIFLYDVYDNKWSMADGLPPYARKQHTMHVFSPSPGVQSLVTFGGKHGSSGYSKHLHVYDPVKATWTHPEAETDIPPVGNHASAIKDNTTLFVFGGYNGTHSRNDVYSTDILAPAWEKIDVDGDVPPPCHGHSVVSGTGEWLQYGGVDCVGDDCTFFRDVYSLSHETLSWTKLKVKGSIPRPRASHTWTTVSPSTHVLFGGIGPYFTNFNDVYMYDEFSSSWQFIDAKGAKPQGRFGHAAQAYRGMLLVFGGASCKSLGDCSYLNDVRLFVPATRTWAKVTVQGDYPSARVGAASSLIQEVLYIFGGATNSRMFGEMITIEPDAPVPENSIVYGAGTQNGTAGKDVEFFVQLQDSFHVNRTTGGNNVSVTVVPTTRMSFRRLDGRPIQVVVVDELNGLYKVKYSTPVADTYNVSVSVDGTALMPLSTRVVADLPHPNNTRAKGSGLAACTAGEQCTFAITLVDSFLNKLDHRSPVDVQFIGPKRVMKKVKDMGDGTVKVSYVPETAGIYKVHIRLRAIDIVGSPFLVNVSCNAASEEKSRVEGAGLSLAHAGTLGTATLVLFDYHGNPILSGGDTVKGQLIGPDELACSVVDHNNGTYSLSYTAVKTGSYRLNIILNDAPVEGSPFDVTIKNSHVSAGTSFAYGTGLRYSIAGYRAYFTIQTADDFGNNMTSGDAQINALFAGPGDNKQLCNVTNHGDGRFSVSYITTLAGDFMISVTMWNPEMGFQAIHLSPFLGTTVAAGADPNLSYLFMDSTKNRLPSRPTFTGVMGVHSYFQIQAVDRYGNEKTAGGDRFSAQLEGPVSHDGFVSDNGDGTYTGTYVAPAAGKYWLKVFYGMLPVNGTPIPILVKSNFDVCPNGCSNHGDCKSDACICHAGYSGHDCSVETSNCPANCMGNGACVNNTCFCYPGFSGVSCDQSASLCPNDCSKHGECVDAVCICDEGYEGTDCSDNSATCVDGCMGSGECVNGTCLCYPGFKGANCGQKTKFCPKGCSGNGKCSSGGMCSCFYGWVGLDCSNRLVHNMAQTDAAMTNALQPEGLSSRLTRQSKL